MAVHKKTPRTPRKPKRRLLAVTLVALLAQAIGLEAQTAPTKNDVYEAYTIGVAITIDATARPFLVADLEASDFGRAELVTFTVECVAATPCEMRFTYDGTTATAAIGEPLQDGDKLSLFGFSNIQNFSAIRTGANSASIQPIFHRQ